MVEMFWQLFDLLSPHFFTLIRFTSAPSSPTAQPRRTGACGPETSFSASMEYQSRANLTSRFWSWWPTPPATATSCSQSAGGWHTQVAPLPLLSSQNPAGRQPLTGSFDVKSFLHNPLNLCRAGSSLKTLEWAWRLTTLCPAEWKQCG